VHIAGSDGGPTHDQVYGASENQLAGRQPAKFVYSQSGGVTCIDQKELCVRSGKPPERCCTKGAWLFRANAHKSVPSATDPNFVCAHERAEKFCL